MLSALTVHLHVVLKPSLLQVSHLDFLSTRLAICLSDAWLRHTTAWTKWVGSLSLYNAHHLCSGGAHWHPFVFIQAYLHLCVMAALASQIPGSLARLLRQLISAKDANSKIPSSLFLLRQYMRQTLFSGAFAELSNTETKTELNIHHFLVWNSPTLTDTLCGSAMVPTQPPQYPVGEFSTLRPPQRNETFVPLPPGKPQ